MNHYPLGPPGHSGPDRPKGIPNKVTAEIRQFARHLLQDKAYRPSLRRRLINGPLGPLDIALWYYAYGKPKEHVEMAQSEEGASPSKVVFYIPDNHRDRRR